MIWNLCRRIRPMPACRSGCQRSFSFHSPPPHLLLPSRAGRPRPQASRHSLRPSRTLREVFQALEPGFDGFPKIGSHFRGLFQTLEAGFTPAFPLASLLPGAAGSRTSGRWCFRFRGCGILPRYRWGEPSRRAAFPPPARRGRLAPPFSAFLPHPSRFSMSAKRFSCFQGRFSSSRASCGRTARAPGIAISFLLASRRWGEPSRRAACPRPARRGRLAPPPPAPHVGHRIIRGQHNNVIIGSCSTSERRLERGK